MSGAPRRAAAVQKPLMKAKSKPARSMRRAEMPSWQQGPWRRVRRRRRWGHWRPSPGQMQAPQTFDHASRIEFVAAGWPQGSGGRERRSPAKSRALRAAPSGWRSCSNRRHPFGSCWPVQGGRAGALAAARPARAAGQAVSCCDDTLKLNKSRPNKQSADLKPAEASWLPRWRPSKW